MTGLVSWFIWRSAYLTRVISWRNRCYVAINWAITLIFGRDDSRFWWMHLARFWGCEWIHPLHPPRIWQIPEKAILFNTRSNLHMELYRILSTEVMTRGKFLPEINYLLNAIGNCSTFGSPYWGEWMDLIVSKFQKQRRHFDSVIFEKWSNLHCNFEVADM